MAGIVIFILVFLDLFTCLHRIAYGYGKGQKAAHLLAIEPLSGL